MLLCIMLMNLNSRRSGIQTDLCLFIKVRRSMRPLLPWPSIWIHSEMSDTGRAICAPSPLKSWEGHVSPFRRSSLACYKFRYVWHRPGHLCPPPFSNYGRGTCFPPHSRFKSIQRCQAGPPVPPSQKLGEARVLSFRRSSLVEMPDTSRFAHFTPLIN